MRDDVQSNKGRNYKRESAYQPMTERQLIAARRLISEGLSIRKTALEIGFHESPLRAKLKNDQVNEYQRFLGVSDRRFLLSMHNNGT
ncbi:hypothetical protein GE061_019435 [Apolygus lucorum]|uniref:Uncharacterized protein n=1 Tax=Apolygus lucorum TaxID=248454 RepID=A0A8S9XB38_APOLU|nr:hypothetical protein GE061_019435 [Apolygus lucorum]